MPSATGAAGDDHLADIRRHETVEPAHPALHQILYQNGKPTPPLFFLVTRRQTNIYSGIGFAVEREGEELLAMIARLDRMCNRKILVFGGNTETDA